jgi:NUDIX domain
MNDYQTFAISPNFSVIVLSGSRKIELSDDMHRAIEEIWEQERSYRPGVIFNGKLLNLLSWNNDQLVGEFVDYKLYLAQLRDPNLAEKLQITPVCISGVTCVGDAVLIGQRSDIVSQYPLWYELAPSGGVDSRVLSGDRIDLARLVLLELEEETGLTSAAVVEMVPFALFYEGPLKSMEICVRIIIDPQEPHAIIPPGNEYSELFWMPISDLASFMDLHRTQIIPLSLRLMRELSGVN